MTNIRIIIETAASSAVIFCISGLFAVSGAVMRTGLPAVIVPVTAAGPGLPAAPVMAVTTPGAVVTAVAVEMMVTGALETIASFLLTVAGEPGAVAAHVGAGAAVSARAVQEGDEQRLYAFCCGQG